MPLCYSDRSRKFLRWEVWGGEGKVMESGLFECGIERDIEISGHILLNFVIEILL